MELAKLFGRNVRKHRQAKGLTQEALAFDANMKRSYLNELESGKRNPTLAIVERLAGALAVEPKDLFQPSN